MHHKPQFTLRTRKLKCSKLSTFTSISARLEPRDRNPDNKLKPANPSKLFGTDGIRGEAGRFPLDPSTVRVIGGSLARHLAEHTRVPRIVTGRDTRESGASIERE